jgi:hypothetical protein
LDQEWNFDSRSHHHRNYHRFGTFASTSTVGHDILEFGHSVHFRISTLPIVRASVGAHVVDTILVRIIEEKKILFFRRAIKMKRFIDRIQFREKKKEKIAFFSKVGKN